jgi:hypothetical protein
MTWGLNGINRGIPDCNVVNLLMPPANGHGAAFSLMVSDVFWISFGRPIRLKNGSIENLSFVGQ